MKKNVLTVKNGWAAAPAGFAAMQTCLDQFSGNGHWTEDGQQWVSTSSSDCEWRAIDTLEARRRLANQHVMLIGDLHARLFFSALVYLVNGTASPEEVAPGIMPHKWLDGATCAWNPDRQASAWYDWAGWAEFAKDHACHVRAYGWPNLHNVTLPKASSWWGVGNARDVMTMLQKENPRYATFSFESITISYVWRSVIRTVGASADGAYIRQHPKVVEKCAALIGRGAPTIIVPYMYAFDAQWQGPTEVGTRMRGLFRGLKERFGQARLLTLGPSSCQPRRPYSVYMSKTSRHNIFHQVENASALRPHAREAAANQSVLYIDTLPSKIAFTPTRLTPCHYDLPLGPMSEALVQIALNGVFAGVEARG